MTKNEYKLFKNRYVSVLTTARQMSETGNASLSLEGKLIQETKNNLILENKLDGKEKIEPFLVSKDQIIALYLKE